MNTVRYPVVVTKIADLCIHSVLDDGFFKESEMAPIAHAHASYELLIATDGEFYIDVQGKAEKETFLLKTGCAFLVPPGVYHYTHGILGAQNKLALRFNCVCDKNTKSNRSVFKNCERILSECKEAKIIDDGAKLSEIIREIRNELNSDRIASGEYAELLINQLYLNLFRFLDTSETNEKSPSVILTSCDTDDRQITIENFLSSHYSENLTEDDLALEMNLSKRHLSRIIRQIFGTSFRQLLIDVRLNRAAQLLIETDISAEDIAASVGYTSLSGFYSAFKDRFSMSVGRYRKIFASEN